MEVLEIIILLVLMIIVLIAFSVFQIRAAGMKVKDFAQFIQANQILDNLYDASKKYKKLSKNQQLVFLMEAEKVLMHLIRYQICCGKMSIKNIHKY